MIHLIVHIDFLRPKKSRILETASFPFASQISTNQARKMQFAVAEARIILVSSAKNRIFLAWFGEKWVVKIKDAIFRECAKKSFYIRFRFGISQKSYFSISTPVRSPFRPTFRCHFESPWGIYILNIKFLCLLEFCQYARKYSEKAVLWNDKDLKIKWGIKKPIISKKDRSAQKFKDIKF